MCPATCRSPQIAIMANRRRTTETRARISATLQSKPANSARLACKQHTLHQGRRVHCLFKLRKTALERCGSISEQSCPLARVQWRSRATKPPANQSAIPRSRPLDEPSFVLVRAGGCQDNGPARVLETSPCSLPDCREGLGTVVARHHKPFIGSGVICHTNTRYANTAVHLDSICYLPIGWLGFAVTAQASLCQGGHVVRERS